MGIPYMLNVYLSVLSYGFRPNVVKFSLNKKSNVLVLLLLISLHFKVKSKKLIQCTRAWNNLSRHLSPSSEQSAKFTT